MGNADDCIGGSQWRAGGHVLGHFVMDSVMALIACNK
jgi:hypothetical protein